MGLKGALNPRWNGGISEYPNHYQMKLARIERFKQTKGLCEICGKDADVIHHIDYSKSNHKLDNLLVVCNRCHVVLHTRDNPKVSLKRIIYHKRHTNLSFKKTYGFRWIDLQQKFGLSQYEIHQHHKKGTLLKYIEDHKGEINA